MLRISGFFPDTALKESAFSDALTHVAKMLAVYKKHAAQSTDPILELQFMLSGRFDTPGFQGMRICSFDTRESILRMDTAVPKDMNHSEAAERYIIAALKDATDNAAQFLSEIPIAFDLDLHIDLIDTVHAAPALKVVKNSKV